MNRWGERGKRYFVFLCVVLVLLHTLVLFLPHADDCVDLDCFVCALIKTSRELLIGAVLSMVLYRAAALARRAVDLRKKSVPICGTTPTELKVKLLN